MTNMRNQSLSKFRVDSNSDFDAVRISSFGKAVVLRKVGRWDAKAIEEYFSLESNGEVRADDLFDPNFVKDYYRTSIRSSESELAFVCRFASKPWCYPTRTRVAPDADIIRQSQYFDEAYLKSQLSMKDVDLDLATYYCTELFRYGINPSSSFLMMPYMISNVDLGEVEVNGLLHYEGSGRAEGRQIFDSKTVNNIFGAYLVQTNRAQGAQLKGALMHAARGGLMNRLIPALSTIIEARRSSRSAILCWSPDEHCAANFEDLFATNFASLLKLSSADLPAGPATYWINHLERDEAAQFPETDTPALIVQSVSAYGTGNDAISNFSEFGQIWQRLTYSSAVEQMLDASPHIDASRTIGLHVRRPYENGFAASLENSKFKVPLQRYVDVVYRVIEAFPALSNVFLCSNSPAAEREIASKIKNVATRPKKSYDNTTSYVAVQDALVDSILLSRCKIVISQEASSFGYFSSIVSSGVCLFVMNDEDTPSVDVCNCGIKIANLELDDNFSIRLRELFDT